MPEGRSSHDVAVVGDKLIIVGGWDMLGAGKGEKWMDTTLVMDHDNDEIVSAVSIFDRTPQGV